MDLGMLRRHAPALGTAGALLVLVENLLFLAGLGVVLGLGSAAGARLSFYALFLDLPGIAFFGVALLLLTRPAAWRDRTERFGFLSGVLCLAWLVLTVAWRFVGVGSLGETMEAAAGLEPNSAELAVAMANLFAQVRATLVVWVLASLCLAAAALLFVPFSKARTGEPAIFWPFFAIVNAAATVFVASSLFVLFGGEIDVPLLATAAFVKVGPTPLLGIPAYASLALRCRHLAGGAGIPESKPPSELEPLG